MEDFPRWETDDEQVWAFCESSTDERRRVPGRRIFIRGAGSRIWRASILATNGTEAAPRRAAILATDRAKAPRRRAQPAHHYTSCEAVRQGADAEPIGLCTQGSRSSKG